MLHSWRHALSPLARIQLSHVTTYPSRHYVTIETAFCVFHLLQRCDENHGQRKRYKWHIANVSITPVIETFAICHLYDYVSLWVALCEFEYDYVSLWVELCELVSRVMQLFKNLCFVRCFMLLVVLQSLERTLCECARTWSWSCNPSATHTCITRV